MLRSTAKEFGGNNGAVNLQKCLSCRRVIIPTSGVKLIKHGDRELTVDYGDGTCDNIVTLTNKNGRTVRYEVKN
jgi:hypothetical protein